MVNIKDIEPLTLILPYSLAKFLSELLKIVSTIGRIGEKMSKLIMVKISVSSLLMLAWEKVINERQIIISIEVKIIDALKWFKSLIFLIMTKFEKNLKIPTEAIR